MRNSEIEKALTDFMNQEKRRKLLNYRKLNKFAKKGQILFTGSSLMEHFPLAELWDIDNIYFYNRAIAGSTTDEFIKGINEMALDLEPSSLFINIGTNDMNEREDGEDWLLHLTNNYDYILSRICSVLPDTDVYVMAYYPINEERLMRNPAPSGAKFKTRTMAKVKQANEMVEQLAIKHGATYIDVNDGLTDENGQLKSAYTVEGIHLYADAYRIIYQNLKKYICD